MNVFKVLWLSFLFKLCLDYLVCDWIKTLHPFSILPLIYSLSANNQSHWELGNKYKLMVTETR